MYWLGDAGEITLLYKETGWAMMMARLVIIAACFVWISTLTLLPSSFAQTSSRSADVVVQQALTQQQVTAQQVDIVTMKKDLDETNRTLSSVREDLSTVKGIGMGAAAVIGLLQTLQMILQVKAVKAKA